MSQLEIDGEASLIKGVYNRIIRDYRLEPKSFKITTLMMRLLDQD